MVNPNVMDLPTAGKPAGRPPSRKPFVLQAFLDRFFEGYLQKGLDDYELAIPEAGPYRASFASNRCNRQLGYSLAGVEASNPITPVNALVFEMGHIVGRLVAESLNEFEMDPDVEWKPEVAADLRNIGIPGSAHADVVRYVNGVPDLVIECKSTGGYSFKHVATTFDGPPEGPKDGAELQGAMAAKALGVEKIVVLYVALEAMSLNVAAKNAIKLDDGFDQEYARIGAEWHITASSFDEAIEDERRRAERIIKIIDAGELPARELVTDQYPEGATVVDPKHKPGEGRWQTTNLDGTVRSFGACWQCGYCKFRDRCVEDGA